MGWEDAGFKELCFLWSLFSARCVVCFSSNLLIFLNSSQHYRRTDYGTSVQPHHVSGVRAVESYVSIIIMSITININNNSSDNDDT